MKVGPTEFLDDRRVVVTTGYDGVITDIEPETATLFGFPSVLLKVRLERKLLSVGSSTAERLRLPPSLASPRRSSR